MMKKNQLVRHVLLVVALVAMTVTAASAQDSNGFYYRNPRTGFTYSQGATWGNGYNNGGFSMSNRRSSHSSSYGYGGGSGNRHYWGGNSYSNRNYGVGQYWYR